VVRAWSRSSEPIDSCSHADWLRRSLADPDRHVLIVARAADGLPVATTRYDVRTADGSRARWEISIAVAPEMRGRGFGNATLQVSDSWLLATEPGAAEIVAWVRTANVGSRTLFERNGYRAADRAEDGLECFVRPR
jgi:RimJ/RimL family protein N-acetyltransferase